MGAVVSAADERAECKFAKKSFEAYTVEDVYKACTWCKRVIAPVIAARRASGELRAADSHDDDDAADDSDADTKPSDGADGNVPLATPTGAVPPLTSLFGVNLSFSDFYDVFGGWAALAVHLHRCVLKGIVEFLNALAGPGSFEACMDPATAMSTSLPLDVYKVFNKDGRNRVPALELFMALALYSTGHVKDRMAFCFMVFDDDGNNSLDRVPVCDSLLQ